MAPLPGWTQALGVGLSGISEGFARVPKLREEEEERAFKSAERPLTLAEAALHVQKLRRELQQPKVQALGQGHYSIYDPKTNTTEIRQYSPGAKQPTLTEHAFEVEGTSEDTAGYKALREFARGRYITRYESDRAMKEALLKEKQRQWDQRYAQTEEKLALQRHIAKLRGADAKTLETLRQEHRTQLEKLRQEGQQEIEKLRQGGRETLEEQRQGGREVLQDTRAEAKGTTSQAGSTDLTIDAAQARLKEFRTRPYFPGQAGEKLADLERTIDQLKAQGKNTIGLYLTKKLQRLEKQLDRAAKRAHWDTHPRPQTPTQSPPQGTSRPSAPGSSSSSGARLSGPQGPTPTMIAEYVKQYRGMTPEQAEKDLKDTLTTDPLLRSLVSQAKQQAYVTLYPDRPLQLQVPATPTTPSRLPQPQPATPPQGRTGASTPQPTQQSGQPATVNPFEHYYNTFTDQGLAQEEARLKKADPLGMSQITAHRLAALDAVRRARQRTATPEQGQMQEAPPPPPQSTPQQVIAHYHAHYTNYGTPALLAEQRRLMNADPFGLSAQTSLKLSIINQLLTQRQNAATPQPVAPGPQEPE